MNVIDFIIIYLACGSPFGVYQIIGEPNRPQISWHRVFLSFLLWPLYAVRLIVGHIFPNAERTAAERRRVIEKIRIDIENLIFSGRSASTIFEFREVFYRFTGLSDAAVARTGKTVNELFDITGHRNKSLASRCLSRHNHERLAFHRDRAEVEFNEIIQQMSCLGAECEKLVESLRQIVPQFEIGNPPERTALAIPQAQATDVTVRSYAKAHTSKGF